MSAFLGLFGFEQLLMLLRQEGGLGMLLPLQFYLALQILELFLSSQSCHLLLALGSGQGLVSDDGAARRRGGGGGSGRASNLV